MLRGSVTVSIVPELPPKGWSAALADVKVWSASMITFLGNVFDGPKYVRVESRW